MRDLIARNVGYSTNPNAPLAEPEIVYVIEEEVRARRPRKPHRRVPWDIKALTLIGAFGWLLMAYLAAVVLLERL